MQAATGALKGLRILDLTHALAGPFCSQILADHGADVLKIEPLEGDFFRRMGPFRDDDQMRHFGGLFQSCNRNKRSMALNLKHPEGKALLMDLVKDADALVENYRAGVLDKMGLGYDALKAIKPSLVYTSVRGFGDKAGGESPYMQWPSFDIVAQAMGGWMGITGEDAQHPVKVGGGAGDTVAGLFAAFGTMTALWHARSTGVGQYVDVAMTDSILALSEMVVSQYSYRGVSPVPVGNGIPGLAPFGTVRVKDGVIALAAPHNPQFRELSLIIGMPELINDPRFADEGLRWENNAALIATIESFTTTRTKLELRELFGGKVPFSPIYNAQEIFEDPHFAVRNMLPEVEHPGSERPVSVPGVPVKLSQTPGQVRHRAPMLGEHTREVLKSLGRSEAQIAGLIEAGAVSAQ
ncbi:MAG TPA: CoA transferase [Hydrogenophaga sp.]|uniref:CaiB/BaiF CoA transferase family protein n=1 Tax=Hydrogenophaga sp. TaxID=1904254 RepID=UPI0008C36130|nr:CoA transferase [Hydrogenophaga sp.]OGA76103.1 MAG: formyl-CoA transferase [Burkholderiales bacterium GWE1_65_30]OGA91069.1 MAG: formyl-CoA transferase [Burkholderiales bacterium GWF1_66_17]HAX23306.1 CoA transferase [Hydrogenophaga sp.]HBU19208.1 CoA transferase [Hydrogenophaga sp.]